MLNFLLRIINGSPTQFYQHLSFSYSPLKKNIAKTIMEVEQVLHMNGGLGQTSYANNSSLQVCSWLIHTLFLNYFQILETFISSVIQVKLIILRAIFFFFFFLAKLELSKFSYRISQNPTWMLKQHFNIQALCFYCYFSTKLNNNNKLSLFPLFTLGISMEYSFS